MANTIRIKRGLKANLPALLAGELAYCNDTLELFVGRVNPGNGFTENILVNDIPDLPDLSGFYTKSEIAALSGLGLVFQNEKFDADLALESEATTGTDNTKLMTPLRTTQAITAQTSGILTSGGYLDSGDFASQEEAEVGTSETTIMSPLRTRDSITEILADKTQAEAGLVNNRLMTPLRTAEAIAELSSAVTISTTEPANAKEGDLWWDSSDGTLYIYFDSNGTAIWVEVTFGDQAVQLSDVLTRTNTDEYTPSADFHPATKKYVDDQVEFDFGFIVFVPIWYGSRGVFAGGNIAGNTYSDIDNIEYITIATLGNAVDFGDLTVARSELGGVSDGSRGVFAGGAVGGDGSVSYSTFINIMDYITIATTSNAIDFGDLTLVGRGGVKGTSDGSRGVFAGGYTLSYDPPEDLTIYNIIDYITIATPGNAIDFGDLTSARGSVGATTDGTRAVFGGGSNNAFSGGGGDYFNTIDYITIATPGNAINFGDLTAARMNVGATSDGSRGVFAGGGDDSNPFNTIDYITIATPGNAINFGDLTANREGLGATSDNTRGVFAGGLGDNYSAGNNIEYITIATLGNAVDFGDLSTINFNLAATSGN